MATTTRQISPEHSVDTRRLEAFLHAAHSESFSDAARLLGLVPSAISHAIKNLEEDLECKLFVRRGPRIKLTREGVRLLPKAEHILGQIQSLRTEVSILRAQRDRLSVIAPEVICSRILPSVLPDMHASFPRLHFALTSATPAPDCTPFLQQNQADFLVRPGRDIGDHLRQRHLFDEEVHLYAAPDHFLCNRDRVHREDLRHTVLLTDDAGLLHTVQREWLPQDASGGSAWTLQSADSLGRLTSSGAGIAIAASWVAEPWLKAGLWQRIPLLAPRISRQWFAVWLRTMQPTWAAEVLMGLLQMHGSAGQPKED